MYANKVFVQYYGLQNEFAFLEALPRFALLGYLEGMRHRVRGFGAVGNMSAEEHSKCVLRARQLLNAKGETE